MLRYISLCDYQHQVALTSSSKWHLSGLNVLRVDPRPQYIMRHRDWLSEFGVKVRDTGEEIAFERDTAVRTHAHFRECMGRMRREVLSIFQKPIWAMTEEEAREKEELELIDFGTSLDYEETLASLEVPSLGASPEPAIISPTPFEKKSEKVIPDPMSGYDPVLSHNPFLFPAPFLAPTPIPIFRNLIVSEDAVPVRIPFDPSRLPFLRHCPFV